MAQGDPAPEAGGSTVRTTFARVMVVQVVALLVLWFLQAHYGG